VVGGRLYAGNLSGRVVAIDAGSGERLWTATEGAYSGLIVAGNSVFFVSDRNALIRLDQATGEMIWETELPLYEARRERRRKAVFTYYGPILAGGHLILATGDGEILRFDPETGAALDGNLTLRGGAASQPIVVNDTLYVVSADGRLHAYR
jgi:outer membrane protein assembly factor BamB